jgi:hypothetical protein
MVKAASISCRFYFLACQCGLDLRSGEMVRYWLLTSTGAHRRGSAKVAGGVLNRIVCQSEPGPNLISVRSALRSRGDEVGGTFALKKAARVDNLRILLLDDVMAMGAMRVQKGYGGMGRLGPRTYR